MSRPPPHLELRSAPHALEEVIGRFFVGEEVVDVMPFDHDEERPIALPYAFGLKPGVLGESCDAHQEHEAHVVEPRCGSNGWSPARPSTRTARAP